MNRGYLMIGVGFVFGLSLTTGSKTVSKIDTAPDKTVPLGKNVRPKSELPYSYPTPVLKSDLYLRYSYYKESRQKEYRWRIHPIFAFGVENFLSYAAHFCKYESENGQLEVVSVGSANGTIENEIIAAYANLFGAELRITLVDPEPTYRVDFRTADDLIAERANVARNCVLFVIWPEPYARNTGYDVEAIRKLQPRATLTMYEMIAGISGSYELLACLNPPGFYYYNDGKRCSPRLNCVIEEIIYQEVNIDPGSSEEAFNITVDIQPGEVAFKFRLVKSKRKS